jgi:hypothetical protein
MYISSSTYNFANLVFHFDIFDELFRMLKKVDKANINSDTDDSGRDNSH